MQPDYDYIISGSGCAGLSLLFRFHTDAFFKDKKILVVDIDKKNKNDRTWCFWEKGQGSFESIVCHKWNEIEFLGIDFQLQTTIHPYQYKMIRGIDFYTYIHSAIKENNHIHWLQAQVDKVYTDTSGFATLVSGDRKFTARYIFNSIVFNKPIPQKNQYYFLQHFVGWEIETKDAVFDHAVARFMDFSISQQYGTSFMYVLPVSKHKALVEFTLFTENLLADDAYHQELKKYITEKLRITEYAVSHIEKGVIPMTNISFPQQEKNVINIGIAGNQAKASSGYAFQFIQKRVDQVINTLKQDKNDFRYNSFNNRKAGLYDATLLRVLKNEDLSGASIFTAIFKRNTPQHIFAFLDNESSLIIDLKIMNSVPTKVFLPAALKQMLSAI